MLGIPTAFAVNKKFLGIVLSWSLKKIVVWMYSLVLMDHELVFAVDMLLISFHICKHLFSIFVEKTKQVQMVSNGLV